jgi:T5SS/PEP-CTERM-associated repeat protein
MERRIIAILILLAANCFVFAEDYTWNNSAGGIFSDPCNWTPPGVPGLGGGDTVHFTLPAAYTVTFDNFHNNDALYVDGSDVIFDIAGFSYAALLSTESGHAAIIGDTEKGKLNILNGPVFSREVSIGKQAGSAGSLTLTGSNTSWTTMYDENWHGVWLGEDGDANLSIQDNARFYHGHGLSAFGSESNALIDVNGIDSEWYVDGQFDMSISGKTTTNIFNGGLFEVGKLTMALYQNSSAQINITGQNHESELQVRNDWENFVIGQRGSASIKVYGSKITNYATMILAENPGSTGLLEIHENSWVDCQSSVAVGGTLENAGGTASVRIIDDTLENEWGVRFNPAHLEGQYVKVWPTGTIYMDGGEIVTEYGDGLANPIILQGGTLQGNCMIWAHVQNLGGVVEPYDDSTNKLIDIGYNYTQNAAGTLKIAIGGIEPVSQYSHLRVTHPAYGQVSLDGMLNVELLDGFVPSYDDVFEIIAAQNITGTFNNAVSRYVFETGSFEVIYNNGEEYDSVVLTHYSTEISCPKFPRADFNKDCKVNMIDFAVFAEEWLTCNLLPNCD